MKKILVLIISLFYFSSCYSQFHRDVQVKPFIDTTTVEFRHIFDLWENYMDTLYLYSVQSNFKINKTNNSINYFWTNQEIERFSFPDLVYSVIETEMAFYPIEDEYFLGFARRDTNLFEIKTMFVNLNEDVFHNTPDIILSQPVIRKGNTYKLYNKFSWLLETGQIISKKIGNITYYYSMSYHFNNENATILADRIKKFVKGFKITKVPEIKYLVGDNMTELYSWFGIDYYKNDFSSNMSLSTGKAVPLNNMILSGGGGENYMHEIIHILLKDMKKSNYGYFEEGIACYFGDHFGKSYIYQVKRLKKYLKDNNWIDLSKNLEYYYKNAEVNHSYKPLNKNNSGKDIKGYGDGATNFTYIINAVICDMAFRKGGYDLVKKVLAAKADNVDEYYQVIEKHLGIKREDVNKTIREFVNNNY